MTGTIASIRSQIDTKCIVARCNKDGCSVSLAGAPQRRLIVDFDKAGSPLGLADTRCDYLLLAEPSCGNLWVAPVELKKGDADLGKSIKQLRAGAQAAECLVSKEFAAGARFLPVLASGRIDKNERNKLRAERVKFYDHKEPVRLIKCGAPLMDALCIDDGDK